MTTAEQRKENAATRTLSRACPLSHNSFLSY